MSSHYPLHPEQFHILADYIQKAEYCPPEYICAQQVSDALANLAMYPWAEFAYDVMTYAEMQSISAAVKDWIHEGITSAAEAQEDYDNAL